MSTSSKGAELERKAIAILQGDGFLVHRTVRTPIIIWKGGAPRIIGSHANDVFGVFDLVGTKATHGEIWLQVTDTTNMAARQKKVREVVGNFKSDRDIQVWGWVGGARRRNQRTGEWTRRQYFRRSYWSFLLHGWVDSTPERDGWIDG